MEVEDFGYVERRPANVKELKNEHGKLTNGKGSDEIDQSMRTLSVSVHGDSDSTSAVAENSEKEENNNLNNNKGSKNSDSMLKHTKKSSTPTKTPTSTAVGSENSSGASTMASTNLNSSNSKPTNSINNNNNNNQNNKTTNENTSSSGPDNQVPLPQRFVVKYLGYRETSNLWGIKYTRRPVDEMVTEAKLTLSKNTDKSLPLLKLEVTEFGILLSEMPQNNNPDFPSGKFPIEAISYGVQDLVYTRVFAMIVVKSALITENDQPSPPIRLADIQKATNAGTGDSLPFRCHAFVCDSRATARRLTYSLATAFHKFSQSVAAGKIALQKTPKKFAIDLRDPEDIEADLIDSEA